MTALWFGNFSKVSEIFPMTPLLVMNHLVNCFEQRILHFGSLKNINPCPQIGDGLSYEPKKICKTGNGDPAIRTIAFPVCISGYSGQTVGVINKSHKIYPPQVGDGLSYKPKIVLQNWNWGPENPKYCISGFYKWLLRPNGWRYE